MQIAAILVCAIGVVLAAKLPLEDESLIAEETTTNPPPKPYNFGFEVRDANTTNYQNRAEVSDEFGRIKGSYSYVLPDGFVYTVTYEDKKDGNGLLTTVRKEPSGIKVIIPEQRKKKQPVRKSDGSPVTRI